MSNKGNAVMAGVALTAVVLTTAYLVNKRRKNDEEQKAPSNNFPVEYERPSLPIAFSIIGMLPKSIRRNLAVKGSAPAPPRDAIDVLGEDTAPDPFDIAEIKKGKIWRVRYKFLTDPKLAAAMKSLTGKSFDDADAVLANVPPEMKDTVRKDIELSKKKQQMTEEESIDHGYFMTHDMLVARLDTPPNDSGKFELIVYNPCRMRPRIVEWLNSIGTVSYIISGSSSHTNQLCQATQTFPLAKIVCAEVAETKCMAAGMRKADYLYTNEEDLKALNAELLRGGAELHFVHGDTFTHAALLLVHDHLFECDLAYGRHCGTRPIFTTKEYFESPGAFEYRLFYYTSMVKGASRNGYLPDYRLLGMDPSSVFATKMMLDAPKPDGSSCTDMANSLRRILALKFDAVDMVHSALDSSISANDFRKTMDACWNWLDGKSLL